jgi:hypothetical protein
LKDAYKQLLYESSGDFLLIFYESSTCFVAIDGKYDELLKIKNNNNLVIWVTNV